TDEYQVLGCDSLGGSGDSTGPEPGAAGPTAERGVFPSISSYDQAEALAQLLDHLGLASLAAIAGGSYGGMVGLAFAERYPERVARLIVIGAPDRSHPLATAWRSVQRRIVSLAAACGQAQEGLKVARALAMTTYRSAAASSAGMRPGASCRRCTSPRRSRSAASPRSVPTTTRAPGTRRATCSARPSPSSSRGRARW